MEIKWIYGRIFHNTYFCITHYRFIALGTLSIIYADINYDCTNVLRMYVDY